MILNVLVNRLVNSIYQVNTDITGQITDINGSVSVSKSFT